MILQLTSDYDDAPDTYETSDQLSLMQRDSAEDPLVIRSGMGMEFDVVGNDVTISYPESTSEGAGEILEFDLISEIPGPVRFIAGYGVTLTKTETLTDVKLTVSLLD